MQKPACRRSGRMISVRAYVCPHNDYCLNRAKYQVGVVEVYTRAMECIADFKYNTFAKMNEKGNL
jgi:hypothetical protein